MTDRSNFRAIATFELTWDEQPYDEGEGARLARVRVTKTWQGDIEGTSVAELVTAISTVEGSAGYVAIERISGSVHGRAGSVVLQHHALAEAGVQAATIVVVPDTGTGELTGIRGEMQIDIASDGKHTVTFDYSLE